MMLTMRSLRRLIVPIYTPTYIYYTSRIKAIYASPTLLFNSCYDFNLSGSTVCKYYHAEPEATTQGGSDFSSKGKEINKRSITKGDTISLNDLLFTKNRDYLIKNNNQHVKAKQFEGKVVGIYFLPLYDGFTQYSKRTTALLKDVYDDLHPDSNFEVVVVAYNDLDTDYSVEVPVHRSLQSDSQKHFDNLFSCMPWTAIAFSDVTSRKHMQLRFGVRDVLCSPIIYIIDQTGMVLQCDSWEIFEYYGALGYPFSDKRLKSLRTEDYEATQQPSLRTLLGSHQRDYVISNKGDKYTNPSRIHVLSLGTRKYTTQYELPGLGPTHISVESLCSMHNVTSDYIEPFGSDILLKYKIRGYPFTRKKAAELENEKVKELKLDMLWDQNTVFRRNDGSQVPFSQLSGKRVMLVLETFNSLRKVGDGSIEVKSLTEFLTVLKERYLKKKGTADEFEVIRILINNTESSVSKYLVEDMPWLVSPASELIHDIGSSYFWYGLSTDHLLLFYIPVFVFDLDGRLVRKTIFPTFEASEFPFYAGGLEEETLSQLITHNLCWNYSDKYFRYKGRIYT